MLMSNSGSPPFLVRVVRFAYWRSRPAVDRLRERVMSSRARLAALIYGCRLTLPVSAIAAVSFRCEGNGEVLVGERVRLGYRRSLRLGSGEILFSTRCKNAIISVGDGAWINNNCSIIARSEVRIGPRCLFGFNVMLADHEAHAFSPEKRHDQIGDVQPIVIGENVWLGDRVTVLKGVTIGENSVIGAGAVVSKSLPSNVIAAGVPARVIRELDVAQERVRQASE
jgi:galactoside O-acetyltransferase